MHNPVNFASVMCGHRAAGRGGGGAVMGSKNLLAVAVTGTGKIVPAKPDPFKVAVKEAFTTIKKDPMSTGFREFGTIGDMPDNDEDGDWPTQNWRSNSWGKGTDLFDHFQENNFIKPNGCYRGCPISCGRIVEVKQGQYKTPSHEGGEYESMSVFTAFVLNEDMDAAVYCDYLCNEYGIDTISCGAMIAFAMECFEKGIITREDTGGIDLIYND